MMAVSDVLEPFHCEPEQAVLGDDTLQEEAQGEAVEPLIGPSSRPLDTGRRLETSQVQWDGPESSRSRLVQAFAKQLELGFPQHLATDFQLATRGGLRLACNSTLSRVIAGVIPKRQPPAVNSVIKQLKNSLLLPKFGSVETRGLLPLEAFAPYSALELAARSCGYAPALLGAAFLAGSPNSCNSDDKLDGVVANQCPSQSTVEQPVDFDSNRTPCLVVSAAASHPGSNPVERMKLVMAFAVSMLHRLIGVSSRPFSPLLGETFHGRFTSTSWPFVAVELHLEQSSTKPYVTQFNVQETSQEAFAFDGVIECRPYFAPDRVDFCFLGGTSVRFPDGHTIDFKWPVARISGFQWRRRLEYQWLGTLQLKDATHGLGGAIFLDFESHLRNRKHVKYRQLLEALRLVARPADVVASAASSWQADESRTDKLSPRLEGTKVSGNVKQASYSKISCMTRRRPRARSDWFSCCIFRVEAPSQASQSRGDSGIDERVDCNVLGCAPSRQPSTFSLATMTTAKESSLGRQSSEWSELHQVPPTTRWAMGIPKLSITGCSATRGTCINKSVPRHGVEWSTARSFESKGAMSTELSCEAAGGNGDPRFALADCGTSTSELVLFSAQLSCTTTAAAADTDNENAKQVETNPSREVEPEKDSPNPIYPHPSTRGASGGILSRPSHSFNRPLCATSRDHIRFVNPEPGTTRRKKNRATTLQPLPFRYDASISSAWDRQQVAQRGCESSRRLSSTSSSRSSSIPCSCRSGRSHSDGDSLASNKSVMLGEFDIISTTRRAKNSGTIFVGTEDTDAAGRIHHRMLSEVPIAPASISWPLEECCANNSCSATDNRCDSSDDSFSSLTCSEDSDCGIETESPRLRSARHTPRIPRFSGITPLRESRSDDLGAVGSNNDNANGKTVVGAKLNDPIKSASVRPSCTTSSAVAKVSTNNAPRGRKPLWLPILRSLHLSSNGLQNQGTQRLTDRSPQRIRCFPTAPRSRSCGNEMNEECSVCGSSSHLQKTNEISNHQSRPHPEANGTPVYTVLSSLLGSTLKSAVAGIASKQRESSSVADSVVASPIRTISSYGYGLSHPLKTGFSSLRIASTPTGITPYHFWPSINRTESGLFSAGTQWNAFSPTAEKQLRRRRYPRQQDGTTQPKSSCAIKDNALSKISADENSQEYKPQNSYREEKPFGLLIENTTRDNLPHSSTQDASATAVVLPQPSKSESRAFSQFCRRCILGEPRPDELRLEASSGTKKRVSVATDNTTESGATKITEPAHEKYFRTTATNEALSHATSSNLEADNNIWRQADNRSSLSAVALSSRTSWTSTIASRLRSSRNYFNRATTKCNHSMNTNLVAVGFGSWLSHIQFDGKTYWNVNETPFSFLEDPGVELLPSDSRCRKDISLLRSGADVELIEFWKRRYETRQKQDRLRRRRGRKALRTCPEPYCT